jgi:lactoylglutathione lyase
MARSTDYIGATGIGVSDLKRSSDFYVRVLGMQAVQTFKLEHMEEIVLTHEGRNAVVLMHYTDGSNPNYKNLPVKLVFYVSDPKSVAARVREAGYEVTRDPAPVPSFGNAIVGLAKDPDGYVIELLEAPAARQQVA